MQSFVRAIAAYLRKSCVLDWFFWFVVFTITAADLVLLEQKYNIFSGGFLVTHRIAGYSDRALFVFLITASEYALAYFFWCLFTFIGIRQRIPTRKISYLFLILYGAGSGVIAIAKYQILSYFGDFLSLAILRNLGGGSLRDGLMYGLEEGIYVVVIGIFIAIVCWFLYKRMVENGEFSQPPSATLSDMKISMALSLVVMVSLSLIATHAMPELRRYFNKTTPNVLSGVLIDSLSPVRTSTLDSLLADSKRFGNRTPSLEYQLTFPKKKENLFFIVSESTRADALDTDIDGQAITPIWRELANQGSVGRAYFSHTGFTTSSLKAIFRSSLGSNLPLGGTLFNILKSQGYQIVVLSGQDETFGDISKDCGMDATADIFFDARSAKDDRVFSSSSQGSLSLSNDRILKEFKTVVAKLDWQRPIFMYINLQAAHFPYFHKDMPLTAIREPLARNQISDRHREELKATYFNAVAYSDWATGIIVDEIRNHKVYNQSLVAVSGDHGESLFEDGILGHGIRITNTQMHTLLVANRHIEAFDRLIGQQDLAKHLLKGLGVKFTPDFEIKDKPVIQLIGSLREPSELGYVYIDGNRLTVDFHIDEVSATWLTSPVKIADLAPKSREHSELMQLVREWGEISK